MGDLETKVIGGLVVAALGAAGGFVWRRARLWRRYRGLAGTYAITRKLAHERERERLVIATKGNILKVIYEELPAGDSVRGEITMSGDTGEGKYTHIKNGMRLWGRWTVQLEPPDSILVERTYTSHKTHENIVSGYVWERIGPGGDPNAAALTPTRPGAQPPQA